ncbi:SDR family NAD(P)-dependent oxidoreductase [Rossellomorea sp. H39__3]
MTIFHNQALQNQHILITGATGGIGHETAIAAIEAGANVTVTGRNEDKLAKLKESVQSP